MLLLDLTINFNYVVGVWVLITTSPPPHCISTMYLTNLNAFLSLVKTNQIKPSLKQATARKTD